MRLFHHYECFLYPFLPTSGIVHLLNPTMVCPYSPVASAAPIRLVFTTRQASDPRCVNAIGRIAFAWCA